MQSTNQKQLDLECLPEEARRQLLDFYEYLLNKYTQQMKTTNDIEKEILADQIQIDTRKWKFKREEIYER